MKKSAFIIVLSIMLTACARVPDTVIIEKTAAVAEPTESEQNSEDVLQNKSNADEQEKMTFMQCDGEHIVRIVEMMSGALLTIDADVNVGNVERVSSYEYIIKPVSDKTREELFDAYFGDRADEAVYDERSGMWELVNSTASAADYYSYNIIFPIPAAVESQEKIVFFYHKPDLNPFEENRLESVSMSGCVLSVNDAVRLCDELVNQVEAFEDLQVDFVHAYGSEGRTPYYRLMYKRVLDGMYVNGYDDIFFLVDDNGIEKIMGAPYGVEEVEADEQIITAYEAADIIAANGRLISSDKPLTVSEITMEYCAVKKTAYEIWIVPVWRFCLGADEDEVNIMRTEILAVNAYTGELIHENRGDIFE